MSSKPTIGDLRRKELMQLKKDLGLSDKDVITTEEVVKGAENKKKYPNLHSKFEWNDEKASYQYRLWQARQLLVEVVVLTPNNKPIQAFVNLVSDRKKSGGGYRETLNVLSDKDLRRELLEQAWTEFESWRRKYESLKELIPVFDAANKVKKQRTRSKRKRNANRKSSQTVSS